MIRPLGLSALASEYQAGRLSKADFIDAMGRCHASWFEYAEFLNGSEVAAIEIRPGRVVLISSGGVRFVIDPIDRRQPICEALHFRSYERMDAEMLYALAPKSGVVFDIGANRGWYSLHLAKRSPGIQVHAFEPIPKTFAALQENINENKLSNVTAHPFGFSRFNGTAEFFFSPDETGASSAANLLQRPEVRPVAVEIRRLDDFWSEWGGRIDFIKCDVEGAELFVFEGGLQAIESRPVIFCEMLRKWSAKFDYHPDAIISLLAKKGYKCFAVDDGRLCLMSHVEETTLQTNFFFLHETAHRHLLDTTVPARG
jgi:FkbM family methyltransferase